MVGECQNTFLQRQTLDAMLIANKVIENHLKEWIPGVLCKQDIEKMYDDEGWDFVLYMMDKLGFGEKWCAWMKTWITSVYC